MGLECKEIETEVLVLPLNFSVSTFSCLKNEYNTVRVGHCYFFAIVAAVKDFIFFFLEQFQVHSKIENKVLIQRIPIYFPPHTSIVKSFNHV